jgi:dihydroorotate dehydrogenase electron transfer subunit
MRRPFSVHDVSGDAFEMIYVARGEFTRGMAGVAVGSNLSLVGPLGNAFEPAAGADLRHVLVAGGVGAPPVHFFAKECLKSLSAEALTVINGARTADLLVADRDFDRLGVDVRITTDDGTRGRAGTVLDELQAVAAEGRALAVYACGPEPMLRAVASHCVERGVVCSVSLETVMPCGTGVCMGCVVKVRSAAFEDGFTYARACHEGPVFRAEDLLWD